MAQKDCGKHQERKLEKEKGAGRVFRTAARGSNSSSNDSAATLLLSPLPPPPPSVALPGVPAPSVALTGVAQPPKNFSISSCRNSSFEFSL